MCLNPSPGKKDEIEMLDDELFDETAGLLKSNTDHRKHPTPKPSTPLQTL